MNEAKQKEQDDHSRSSVPVDWPPPDPLKCWRRDYHHHLDLCLLCGNDERMQWAWTQLTNERLLLERARERNGHGPSGRRVFTGRKHMVESVMCEGIMAGLEMSEAVYDAAGNCMTCCEAGHCPGAHIRGRRS